MQTSNPYFKAKRLWWFNNFSCTLIETFLTVSLPPATTPTHQNPIPPLLPQNRIPNQPLRTPDHHTSPAAQDPQIRKISASSENIPNRIPPAASATPRRRALLNTIAYLPSPLAPGESPRIYPRGLPLRICVHPPSAPFLPCSPSIHFLRLSTIYRPPPRKHPSLSPPPPGSPFHSAHSPLFADASASWRSPSSPYFSARELRKRVTPAPFHGPEQPEILPPSGGRGGSRAQGVGARKYLCGGGDTPRGCGAILAAESRAESADPTARDGAILRHARS